MWYNSHYVKNVLQLEKGNKKAVILFVWNTDMIAICRGRNYALLNPYFLDPNSLFLSLSLGMSKKTNSIALPLVVQIQHMLGWEEFLITVFSHHLRHCWDLLGNYQGYLLSPLTSPAQKFLICTMMKSVKGRNCEFFILFFSFLKLYWNFTTEGFCKILEN